MIEAFPLAWPQGWPRTPAARRENSRFARATHARSQTIQQLQDELRRLGATNVVISSNVPLRQDGMPYANQIGKSYDDPGVAVYFKLKGKPLSMARDKYRTPWENMRSLSLAIEAIRSIERHGGSTMMERAFSGFSALPPPAAAKASWWDVLQVNRTSSEVEINENYRRLARDRHPDTGGSEAMMSELNAARDEALRALRAG